MTKSAKPTAQADGTEKFSEPPDLPEPGTPLEPVAAPVLTNPGFSSIPLDTTDLGQIQFVLEAIVSALQAPDAPRSRHRSILITELEGAALRAGKGQREEV